jgi:NAD(P)-dependent dehydrogenase (short-subunit alcohol dehydrogenase family)
LRFTETLAEETRGTGIEANAAPGALNTRLLDEVLAAGADRTGEASYQRSIEQKEKKEKGGAPMENAAELCAFLLSRLSDGISGKTDERGVGSLE